MHNAPLKFPMLKIDSWFSSHGQAHSTIFSISLIAIQLIVILDPCLSHSTLKQSANLPISIFRTHWESSLFSPCGYGSPGRSAPFPLNAPAPSLTLLTPFVPGIYHQPNIVCEPLEKQHKGILCHSSVQNFLFLKKKNQT